MKTRILVILIVFTSLGMEAQIRHPGKPVPLDIYPVSGIPVIEPSCTRHDRTVSDDRQGQTRLKRDDDVVLCEMNADYKNTGTWHILQDGRSIWRTGIYVRNAVALNLVFSRFNLEKGASVFLYDEKQEEILGAYTYRNNKESGIFAASPVHSDLVYVELQLTDFVTSPGDLEIGYVAADYQSRKSTDAVLDTFYRMSGECNVDINCNTDPEIQELKHAVIRIVYDGVERCTGTLVNTTRMDGYPFVLTAGHCIDNQKRANTALFYFNYESPACGGRDGSTAFSISGSNLLATTDNQLDFSLLELSESVPFYYHPYFAGWDNRNEAPGSSYAIHHPQGDVKKISVDSDPAVTANYGEGYDANTHWRILEWDSGTTEKGSSGCPLFNVNNRVVGTLTGGSAMCGYSYDDYFQKFYHCWADYPSTSNQLQFWLDPMQKNISFIDGYDPYSGFWASGDTLTNILEGDIIRVYSFRLSWGYNSGHNSDSVRIFAEKFNMASDAEIIGVILNVGPLNAGSADSKIRLHIWNEELLPGKIIYSADVPLFDMAANDDFLAVFDSSVSVGKEFYAGFEIFYDLPGDTFAVNMQMNNETDGENTAFVRSDAGWQLLTDYLRMNLNASFDIRPVIFDSIPVPPGPDIKPPEDDVFLYPVPADETINIMFWELPRHDVKIDLYDVSGRLVKSELFMSPPVTIEYFLNKIPSGMYIIKMNVNNFIITKKFIVVSEY